MKKFMKNAKKYLIILVFYLGLWQVAATLIDNEIVLSFPVDTIRILYRIIISQDSWFIISNSISKILLGYFFACILGIVFSIICHRKKYLKILIDPFFSAMRSIPVACFIVIALIWIGSQWTPCLISSMIVFPIVYLSTINALGSVSKDMLQMCDIYEIGYLDRIKNLYIPYSFTSISSSIQVSLGMSIKAGIAAEVIASSDLTIGGELFLSKLYLDTTTLFAWTFIIVVISWLLEIVLNRVIKYIEKKIFRGGIVLGK